MKLNRLKKAIILLLIFVVLLGVKLAIAEEESEYAENAMSFISAKAKEWFEVGKNDGFFFADNVYGAIAYTLNYLFIQIFTSLIQGYKTLARSIFGLGMMVYLTMGFTGRTEKSFKEVLRTVIVGTATFNIVVDLDTFSYWIYDFVFMLPRQVSDFVYSVKIPVFKTVSAINHENLIWLAIQAMWNEFVAKFSVWDVGKTIAIALLYLAIIIILYIYYLIYWYIQINYVMAVFLYMVVGVPVIFLATFKGTQSVFNEWCRGVITLMLYPIFAALIIFVVNNFILWATLDLGTMTSEGSVVAPVLAAATVAFFGIAFLRQVPNYAATLTRGQGMAAVDAGGPTGMIVSAIKNEVAYYRQAQRIKEAGQSQGEGTGAGTGSGSGEETGAGTGSGSGSQSGNVGQISQGARAGLNFRMHDSSKATTPVQKLASLLGGKGNQQTFKNENQVHKADTQNVGGSVNESNLHQATEQNKGSDQVINSDTVQTNQDIKNDSAIDQTSAGTNYYKDTETNIGSTGTQGVTGSKGSQAAQAAPTKGKPVDEYAQKYKEIEERLFKKSETSTTTSTPKSTIQSQPTQNTPAGKESVEGTDNKEKGGKNVEFQPDTKVV